jgi:hypothetical protein
VTPDKPFGCIASPFTLNRSGTLVVRNRYRMLVCYVPKAREDRDDHPPAFEAFRASLDLIYGDEEAARIVTDLLTLGEPDGTGPSFLVTTMPRRSFDILTDNDHAKKNLGESS